MTAFLLLLSVLLSLQWSREDTTWQAVYNRDLQYVSEMQARATDSIYQSGNVEAGEINLDTLFSRCAQVGYEAMSDQMDRYYVEVLDRIPADADRHKELLRMREAIKRTGAESVLKRELRYGEAVAMPDNTLEKRDRKIAAFYTLADKSKARNDAGMEMRALMYVFLKCYMAELYYEAFVCADRIARRLTSLTEADYPEKKSNWYELGRIYYDFRDYDHAVPYLKAALSDVPVTRFYYMNNIKARNVLGVYYREIGELDSSDYYFRSILASKDRVKMRPMMDCIALSNLATNYRARGRYREALVLHKSALPFSLKENDPSFTSGIYVGMADCYLEIGYPDSCKAMMDSALFHIEKWPWVMSYRSCDLYPVMARYYARLGDQERSIAYMDSTTVANRRQDEKYSALLILRAKQELFASEQQRKDLKVASFRRTAMVSIIVSVIIFISMMVLLVFYRKKHKAYRKLAAESREWAKLEPVMIAHPEADAADIALVESANKLIEEEKIFLDPNLDMDSLSQRMGVHRNLLSKAINTVYNKPFNAYLNECRVRHAILLLSDPANDQQSLEVIALDAGFSSRSTFYRAFKAQTGINPATFRKNREG